MKKENKKKFKLGECPDIYLEIGSKPYCYDKEVNKKICKDCWGNYEKKHKRA